MAALEELAAVADPAETEGLVEPVPAGGPPPVPAALTGDGAYAVPVLGEVHVGRILAAVCHDGLPPVGQDKVVSAVVRVEDIFRQYSGGRLTPVAIRDFLRWAPCQVSQPRSGVQR